MKSRRRKLKRKTTNTALGFAIASLLFPSLALAQVRITEIMYDVPGSDAGREWVEVTNLGAENVDIGKYKFFEDGTNHGLKLVAGSSSLAPNASAVIADDTQKFLSDYPSYVGALFDSAFSLSNTGETLSLKDASSTVLDTAAYSATEAANGTGGTLNYKDGAWVAAMASPGAYPGPMTPVPKIEKPAGKTTAKKSASTSPSASKKSTSTSPSSASNIYTSLPSAPAAASLSLPELPESVLAGLGLVAVILLGVAGVFFLKPNREATSLSADEFTIE